MDAPTAPGQFDAGARTADIFDAVELESLLGAQAECLQLSSGTFRARTGSAQLGAVRIIAHDCNRRVEIRRSVPPEMLALVYADKAERVLEHGRLLAPHQIVAAKDAEIDLTIPAGAEMRWIDIDEAALVRSASSRSTLISGDSAAALQLRSYVDLILQISADEPLKFQSDGLRQRMEADLLLRVERLVLAGDGAAGGLARERKAFALVRNVEHFMWEHVDEPLTLERICQHTGCRMRSLIYSFKDAFGVGPITYLKILRLNAAHRRLRASHGTVRIFDVAAALGFWHMGHFSADYKRLFGVTASETAGRSPMPRFKSRIAQRP